MGKTTLNFLRASIDFIPKAIMEYRANMRNTSFIYNQPGKKFVITAGKGDWEFTFSQSNGKIYCDCLRKPMYRYIWDGVRWALPERLLALTDS